MGKGIIKSLVRKSKDRLAGLLLADVDYSSYSDVYQRILKDKENYPIEFEFIRKYYIAIDTPDHAIFDDISKWAKNQVEFAVLCTMAGKLTSIAQLKGSTQLLTMVQLLDNIPEDVLEYIEEQMDWEMADILSELEVMDEYEDFDRTLTDEEIDELTSEELSDYIDLQLNKLEENKDETT